MDDERSEFKLALEWSLQHVGVLDSRSGYERFRTPEDAASDGQSVLVDSISDPSVSSIGPDVARHCGHDSEHGPGGEKTELEAVTPRSRDRRHPQGT